MRVRVRKLRDNERTESIGRWAVSVSPQQGDVYFWAFIDWEGALRFALWKVGAQRNYGADVEVLSGVL